MANIHYEKHVLNVIQKSPIVFDTSEYISFVPKENRYEGPYQVVPNNNIQVLKTNAKTMMQDIVINPIPSNYGLVSWNGTVLTIS